MEGWQLQEHLNEEYGVHYALLYSVHTSINIYYGPFLRRWIVSSESNPLLGQCNCSGRLYGWIEFFRTLHECKCIFLKAADSPVNLCFHFYIGLYWCIFSCYQTLDYFSQHQSCWRHPYRQDTFQIAPQSRHTLCCDYNRGATAVLIHHTLFLTKSFLFWQCRNIQIQKEKNVNNNKMNKSEKKRNQNIRKCWL